MALLFLLWFGVKLHLLWELTILKLKTFLKVKFHFYIWKKKKKMLPNFSNKFHALLQKQPIQFPPRSRKYIVYLKYEYIYSMRTQNWLVFPGKTCQFWVRILHWLIFIAKILVTTGYPDDHSVHSEVIDSVNPNSICQPLPNLPVPIRTALGGLLNNKPIICGGFSVVFGKQNQCYFVGSNEVINELIQPRSLGSGVILNDDILWVTGKYSR